MFSEWETIQPAQQRRLSQSTKSEIVIKLPIQSALKSTLLGIPEPPSRVGRAAVPPASKAAVPSDLKKSFAKLFQVSSEAPLSDAAAEALSERIIQEIIQPSATDFTEILEGTQQIRIVNNATTGIKKARTAASSLGRTVTLIPLETEPIGQGSYGTIYREISPEGKAKARVLKEIRVDEMDPSRNQLLRGIMTELLIQHILAADTTYGKNVAKPHAVLMDLTFPTYKIYIYMDQIPSTFKDYMKTGPTVAQLKSLFISITNILKHFRDTYTFYHCDFHIGNIMMSFIGGEANPVIIDFGFSSLTYPGLAQRIYGKYVGEAPVNDLLIFIVAFISRYGGQIPTFARFLRGLLRAVHSKNPAFNIADAYLSADTMALYGEHLFHKFYYFSTLGNPMIYSYPLLEYDNMIKTIEAWKEPVAAAAPAAAPAVAPAAAADVVDPVSIGHGIMPLLPRYAPGDHVGEKRSQELSIPGAQPNRVAALSPIPEERSAAAATTYVPTNYSKMLAAQQANNRLSGKKSRRNEHNGGNRQRSRISKPKRRARKTHKRPSRR